MLTYTHRTRSQSICNLTKPNPCDGLQLAMSSLAISRGMAAAANQGAIAAAHRVRLDAHSRMYWQGLGAELFMIRTALRPAAARRIIRVRIPAKRARFPMVLHARIVYAPDHCSSRVGTRRASRLRARERRPHLGEFMAFAANTETLRAPNGGCHLLQSTS